MAAPPAPSAPPTQQGPPPSGGAAPDQDPTNLHDLAVDAAADLQKLATGLAHAGAAPQAVSELTKMIDVLHQVVKVLAQAPLDASGPPPGGPPGGPPPSGPQTPQPARGGLHAASQGLQSDMAASAARRQP